MKTTIIDIEANGLKPSKIWVVVCLEVETGETRIWRNLTDDQEARESFLRYANTVDKWVGHSCLSYDLPVLNRLLGLEFSASSDCCTDTLVVSKMANYSRDGHSLEDYGNEFNFAKDTFDDYSKYSVELENRCLRDAQINLRVFKYYRDYINKYPGPINTEQMFQLKGVNALEDNGFYFDKPKAAKYLSYVEEQLLILDKDIHKEFPPREVLIREFTPRATKYGTISKTSVPRSLWDRLHEYEVGQTYRHTRLEEFNPSSHKQIIQVLNEAGWKPVDKTKTHIETERELNRIKYRNKRDTALDLRLKKLYDDYTRLKVYGWKVNENNLATLPPTAPSPARALARRILLEARRRTLTEWTGLVKEDGRIHGRFYGIGTWPHRMSTQNPNVQNIPNPVDTAGKVKLLGKEMRGLWRAPKNRLLVGVDAEGIQLRLFAHLIDDPEFTKALVEGKKEDKSDPHSLNQRILGSICKSRAAAKRFIYALLLGAGLPKLAEILEASEHDTKIALDRLLERYTGWAKLKSTIIPHDAERGWFLGLDGRPIPIPGETVGQRKHLAMSGYLQSGEAIVMKMATLKWIDAIREHDSFIVNMVHDEWQVEAPNNMEEALWVAKEMSQSLAVVGDELKLRCPLAGSYWNDDEKDYTIGTNWSQTH